MLLPFFFLKTQCSLHPMTRKYDCGRSSSVSSSSQLFPSGVAVVDPGSSASISTCDFLRSLFHHLTSCSPSLRPHVSTLVVFKANYRNVEQCCSRQRFVRFPWSCVRGQIQICKHTHTHTLGPVPLNPTDGNNDAVPAWQQQPWRVQSHLNPLFSLFCILLHWVTDVWLADLPFALNN